MVPWPLLLVAALAVPALSISDMLTGNSPSNCTDYKDNSLCNNPAVSKYTILARTEATNAAVAAEEAEESLAGGDGFHEPNCYKKGTKWSKQRDWAIEMTERFCDSWTPDGEFLDIDAKHKQCWPIYGSDKSLMLEMQNGRDHRKRFRPWICKVLMKEIIDDCEKGGEEWKDGWWRRK
jgi:hypothetical protein